MAHRSPNPSRSLLTNYREILGSCLFQQFTLGIDVLQVQSYVVRTDVKQRRHLSLAQPDRLTFDAHVNARLPLVRLIDD